MPTPREARLAFEAAQALLMLNRPAGLSVVANQMGRGGANATTGLRGLALHNYLAVTAGLRGDPAFSLTEDAARYFTTTPPAASADALREPAEPNPLFEAFVGGVKEVAHVAGIAKPTLAPPAVVEWSDAVTRRDRAAHLFMATSGLGNRSDNMTTEEWADRMRATAVRAYEVADALEAARNAVD